MPQSASERIGIFTKGYEATLNPGATNSFVIQHNLGIMPQLCIVEIDRSTVQLTNYCAIMIIDFDTNGLTDKTGFANYEYHYNGTDSKSGLFIPVSAILFDENTITLAPPYSNIRSPFDTSADYHVRVWG